MDGAVVVGETKIRRNGEEGTRLELFLAGVAENADLLACAIG
jgi:hypothetical protein